MQTTCEFCHSILVRTDVDLKKVGEVADLPPDSSPIQIGTEGAYQNKSFVVVGRIIYEYEQGGWNEWHIVYNDGTSGWLSDAQLEYDLSWLDAAARAAAAAATSPARRRLPLERQASIDVTSITAPTTKACEGELPFQYWDKQDMLFADLRTTTATSPPSITARIRRCCSSAARSSSTTCTSRICASLRVVHMSSALVTPP